MPMRVLILDTVHGGGILGKRMAAGSEVTCVDVYGITPDEAMSGLRRCGIRAERDVPEGHYDMVISPVHCPDKFLGGVTYNARKTFHQAVGDLIDDERFRIEITGVKGKTSVCCILAHILSTNGMKVFLHTSRGQGPWIGSGHRIDSKQSIAPTSLLTLPGGEYDVMICEVSLGGSGKADIAAITNIADDYGIAGNTKKASDAKSSILCDNTNIVPNSETRIWNRYGKAVKGYGGRIRLAERPKIGKGLRISVRYGGTREIVLSGSYIQLQYIHAMELALEICDAMNIPADIVMSGLETFGGVPGRGELARTGGMWHVKERNPGISHVSVDHALSVLDRMGVLKNAFVTVDPVNRKVCDKMDTGSLKAVISKYVSGFAFKEPDTDVKIPEGTELVIEFIKEGYQ